MNITIVGLGYVGLSVGILLAQKNNVVGLDIDSEKVRKINNRESPILDSYISDYLKSKNLNFYATVNMKEALVNAEYIVIATPTNYDPELNHFNTKSVEDVIKNILSFGIKTTIIIKSTVPVGFTESIKKQLNVNNIIFSPEFLREGHALYDNLYPSRIVVGGLTEEAKIFSDLLLQGSLNKNVPVLVTNSTEAEAIKLFANTYLAMRVAFFNELDTFAEIRGLNSHNIIEGISLDPRIGNHYNNPSFGYGGYCLPKDTRQLLANYSNIPQKIMSAIVESNITRKHHIASILINKKPKTVGIYRLIMKTDSDNFRDSAIHQIMSLLSDHNIKIIIFEPTLKEDYYDKYQVINDEKIFKDKSDVIVANRFTHQLDDVIDKVYTRDIYRRD